MRLLLVLTSVAVLLGMAGPAYADTTDDAFLVALQQTGITYPDPARAIGAGKWVCLQVGEGKQAVDVVNEILSLNSGLGADNAAKFIAIAAKAYCPTALGGDSGNGGGR